MGAERQAALSLAEQRIEMMIQLVPAARDEGYSLEQIAEAVGISRQQLWSRLKNA
jgi:biotin operon repressor